MDTTGERDRPEHSAPRDEASELRDLEARVLGGLRELRGPVTDLVVHAVEATGRLVEHATRDGLRIAATAQREAFAVARAALAVYESFAGVPRDRRGEDERRPS